MGEALLLLRKERGVARPAAAACAECCYCAKNEVLLCLLQPHGVRNVAVQGKHDVLTSVQQPHGVHAATGQG